MRARLLDILQYLPNTNRYLVAYSGGRDSHVLLHLLSTLSGELNTRLAALHVDHGLQAASTEWSDHCAFQCKLLDIHLEIIRLKIAPEKGKSPEALARQARYEAISSRMEPGDMLLTAHHQDDQAETLLLQLIRGAGPSGLAAMPDIAVFGRGYHARPLLGFSTKQIQAYAHKNRLEWIEDPTNNNTSFDRNYLRQKVMPLLSQRWPAVSRTISRSARHCAEAQAIIDEVSEEMLCTLLDAENGSLAIPELKRLSGPRIRALLRCWIRQMGYPLPNTVRLNQIENEMLNARPDRNPMVHWPGVEMRRYRNRLYLMPPLTQLDSQLLLDWKSGTRLRLPADLGTLTLYEAAGGIPTDIWRRGKIQVRFRRQGERFRSISGEHSVSLKRYFQQRGVPPWERSRIPLTYINDELVAVGDILLCKSYPGNNKKSLHIEWDKAIQS